MFEIILHTPQIPQNTGNIIRLCANCGARLHLIHPLGFAMDEKAVRRAGLDYHDLAQVSQHASLDDCRAEIGPVPLYAVTKFGRRDYTKPSYQPGIAFLFGAETTGLPPNVHTSLAEENKIRLPMRAGNRSLNLSNAVSIVVYEAWRQCGFGGRADGPDATGHG